MNLCIDIGNTLIKCALFDGDTISKNEIFEQHEDTEILKWIQSLSFHKFIFSTVKKKKATWLEKINSDVPSTQLSTKLKLPIDISNYHSSATMGTDRIAAMAGAVNVIPDCDLFIVNAGTCVTYDLVTKSKVFIGGNIAPGLHMRLKAMHDYTDALPLVNKIIEEPGFLGSGTESALFYGAYEGIALEIEGYFQKISQDYPSVKCIITGGNSSSLVNRLKIDIFAEPFLVLKGLNTILNYQ